MLTWGQMQTTMILHGWVPVGVGQFGVKKGDQVVYVSSTTTVYVTRGAHSDRELSWGFAAPFTITMIYETLLARRLL